MRGADMDYFREHGYLKIDVGSADTRAPHAEGKFPTPSGKVEVLLPDHKNFVAGPFRAMYDGEQDGSPIDPLPAYDPPREVSDDQPGTRQTLSAEHCLAEEPRLPELVLCEREAQDQGPGRAVRDDLAGRRRDARHPRRRSGARSQRSRRFQGVARVTDDVNPGIVVATLGYWRSLNRSDGSVNSISSDAWSGLGRAPTFSDNLVEVARVN